MKRLFIAIEIEKNNILAKVAEELQAFEKQVKWVDFDQIHLTLEFLGDTEENLISDLGKVLTETCSKHKVFGLELSGMGTFGKKQRPSVIWVGLIESKNLFSLQSELHAQLINSGFDLENRKYKPHITLGRLKRIENLDRFNIMLSENSKTFLGHTEVKQVILFESTLTQKGPVYNKLCEVFLKR